MQTIFVNYFFNWQIGTKNLTKRKIIVELSFFTSWTITNVNAHGRTCKKTKVYIYLYISLYENLFENRCIYIYIYIYIFTNYWMRLSRIWGILQIKEGVIHPGWRPRWIIFSDICRIFHILRKPNSIIILLFIQNNS